MSISATKNQQVDPATETDKSPAAAEPQDFEADLNSQMNRDFDRAWQRAQNATDPELRRARVKPAELILFTTQLSVMLDSGVVLSDALDAIAESSSARTHATFKSVIAAVADKVKGGESFSKALAAYPRIF
ncbi:MAG: type II secretion system F family protein, partial [Phycisphaerales bacterium]